MDNETNNGQVLDLDAPSVGSESQQEPATAVTQQVNDAAPVAQEPIPSDVQSQQQVDPAVEAIRQQWQQERQALSQELQRRDAEARQMKELLWQVRLANTPEDQRAALIEQRNQQSVAEQRQALQTQQAEFFRNVEPIMKEVVVNKLLDSYRHAGVTREDLNNFSTPEDAEQFCRAMSRRQRATMATRQAPVAQAATTQGAPASKSWKTMSLSEQLGAALAQLQ